MCSAETDCFGPADERTKELMKAHDGLSHALRLFSRGCIVFTKRKTPLALLLLLNELSRIGTGKWPSKRR